MSKNKKNDYQATVIPVQNGPLKARLIKAFGETPTAKSDVDDVVKFLSVENARLLAKMGVGGLAAADEEELIDFFLFFEEKFMDWSAEACAGNWGEPPLVIRVGYSLWLQRERQKQMEYMKTLPIKLRNSAAKLTDALFSIRKDRLFSFMFPEGPGQYFIPKMVPFDELADTRDELLFLCALMLEGGGGVIVRCQQKNKPDVVFGVSATNRYSWKDVPKNELCEAHKVSPDGIPWPEENIIYTELSAYVNSSKPELKVISGGEKK